jgi:hypothetical protein
MGRIIKLGGLVFALLLFGNLPTMAVSTAQATQPFAGRCPTEAPEEGATAKLNRNPAARHTIVPAGAVSVRICRYYGFGEAGKQTPKTQARVGKLQDQAVVGVRDLVESLTLEFKELEAAPNGPVSCPLDEGAELYAVFHYRAAAPVILRVSLAGCRFVSGAVARARVMSTSLQDRLVRLAEGKHARPGVEHGVKEKRAVAYPPPHLTFARARHAAKGDVEYACKESKLCQSWSIGTCSRANAKNISCRYLAELHSGEECRGAVQVTDYGELLGSSPGVQDEDEGECFFLFAPPGFKEELEEIEAERNSS